MDQKTITIDDKEWDELPLPLSGALLSTASKADCRRALTFLKKHNKYQCRLSAALKELDTLPDSEWSRRTATLCGVIGSNMRKIKKMHEAYPEFQQWVTGVEQSRTRSAEAEPTSNDGNGKE